GAESRPTQVARVGDRVFFAANDGTHGIELWVSDGTDGGTYLVNDINPGPADSGPRYFGDVNGIAYFAADDGLHGFELWKSDGTEAGTILVKDIRSGPQNTEPVFFTSFNGQAYFASYDVPGLWKTDGTPQGTIVVRDQDGIGSALWFRDLVRVGNLLFMRGPGGLWKSDGTSAGTVLVKETGSPQNFHEFGGMLIFVAQTDANGYELWKSDGTAAGTLMLKDIRPGTLWGVSPYANFENYNNFLWFSTYDGNPSDSMWKTDGTPEGTVRTSNGSPSSSAQMDGSMYFVDPEGNGTSSLWKMDETGAAQLLKRFSSDAISPANAADLTAVGDRVLFTAPDAFRDFELWSTDGTPEGTTLLKDIEPGTVSSSPRDLIALSGRVVFSAEEETHGLELWQSDGTEAGTTLVKDINPASNGGAGDISVILNNTGYFLGSSEYRPELWKTDGTADGTQKVIDVPYSTWGLKTAAGKIFFTAGGHNFSGLWASDGTEAGTYPLGVTVDPNVKLVGIGDITYFSPNEGTPGLELWRTDGTPGGTAKVKTINPILNWFSTLWVMEALNDKLFFQADDGVHGAEPWISDGTEAGTFMLADIASGAGGSNPTPLATMNNQMLFTVYTGSTLTLWKTDGTSAGTVPVHTLGPGYVEYSIFRQLKMINGKLIFEIKGQGAPNQIWATDGSSASTQLLASISSSGWQLVGDQMFFIGYGAGALELWKTDGTPAGTARITVLTGPGAGSGVARGGSLVFSLNDGVHGYELWSSDGTEAGTGMIIDLNPGPDSSYPSYITEHEGAFYFGAFDHDHGYELWRTDGTATGTTLVQDLFPGPNSSTPSAPAVVNGMLLFSANAPPVGGELWRLIVPRARIGGPSSVEQGSSITLSADQSDNPHGAGPLQFAWDLDGDGQFGETGTAASNGDETGVSPIFSAGNLPFGEWPVRLAVTNSSGQTSAATAYIAVTPPNFMVLSPDAILEWSGSPGARVLTLHGGSFSLDGDLSTVYPGISLVAENAATIHLSATQHIKQLTLLDSATLDLGNASLFVSAPQPQQTLTSIRALIEAGRIFSSTAQADTRLGIGYAFDPASGSVKVMQALLGDLNLDATVSISDFIDLASHFGQTSPNWSDGDLNYDDQVSIADFITLASNFGQSYSGGAAPAQASASEQLVESKMRIAPRTEHPKQQKRAHHLKPRKWVPVLRRWEEKHPR
ncbi:MAG TPA: ELWxxDGT repeat protein, partial [Tepidisphaeraceae bacterium]|nr:ELWxxDGT repeat protein [Tepidisphaeraceae bacterium]